MKKVRFLGLDVHAETIAASLGMESIKPMHPAPGYKTSEESAPVLSVVDVYTRECLALESI